MSWWKMLFSGRHLLALEQENQRLERECFRLTAQSEFQISHIENLRRALDSENLRAEMAEANYKQIVAGNDALVAKLNRKIAKPNIPGDGYENN